MAKWGSLMENGTWSGIIGMVARGEVDMGLTYLAIMEDRSKFVDFSTPYYSFGRTFVTDKPVPIWVPPFTRKFISDDSIVEMSTAIALKKNFLLQKEIGRRYYANGEWRIVPEVGQRQAI
ncbi:lig_chan-Glu_bd domain-containing protein [Caerostris extrusa]|uniref:Lig_chan-Glu_bd domain-containing protein n=1 Tax=Caerostris extrusa TaxID=172846 RepID=A0AAV4QDV8_CAEEX|nr:lig_chan-Glu_bd domain-containing protein [Caerostris extrusa]